MTDENYKLLVMTLLYVMALAAFVGFPVAIITWVIKWIWIN
ncbi:hypothetical protein ACLSZI_05010 [Avibacterium avium]